MKKLLTLFTLLLCLCSAAWAANGDVLFTQSFGGDGVDSVAYSANTARSYTTADGKGLNKIVGTGTNLFTSITCNAKGSCGISINSTNGGNSTNAKGIFQAYFGNTSGYWSVIRTSDFAATAPTALKVSMKVWAKVGSSSSAVMANFAIGDDFSDGLTNGYPATSKVHSGFCITNESSMKFAQYNVYGTKIYNTALTQSSWMTLTWIINNTGSSLTYDNPTGSGTTTLNNDCYDLWLGSTRIVTNQAATTGTNSLQNIYIGSPTGKNHECRLDDIVITDLTPVTGSAPSTPTLTVDGGSVNGNSTTTISSSGAKKIYYCWTSSSTAPAQDAEDTWTEVSGSSYEFTIPNVTANPMYLYAYGWNDYNESSTSTTKQSAAFNVSHVQVSANLAFATAKETKAIGSANFTDEPTTADGFDGTLVYSITTNGTGSSINSSTGEVTIGSKAGTETITVSSEATTNFLAGEATYTLVIYDGGTSGSVGDLVSISSNYTFIADYITLGGSLTASKLYDSNRVFLPNANKVTTKGTSTIDGKVYNNSLSLASAPVVFKVSAPCYATFYVGNNSSRSIKIGTVDDDDKYGTAPNGTSPWSCYITEAATVYIKGTESGDYCLAGFKLFFTEPISTATGQKYSTYVTPCHLDFTDVSGITAYKITGVENSVIQTSALTKVPSGTPLLIETTSTGATVNVPVFASSTPDDINENKLKVGANGIVSDASTFRYVLAAQDDVTGFYKLTTATNVPSTKAYLELTSAEAALAPTLIRLIEDENNTTNIEDIKAKDDIVKFFQNGQLYIRRDGITYDVMGRIVK